MLNKRHKAIIEKTTKVSSFMNIEQKLRKIGFEEKEAQIYLGLLELGGSGIQGVAQKTGIKRTSVYHVLETLKKRGLVGVTQKGKRKQYVAQPPEVIEEELEERKELLRSALPDLAQLAGVGGKRPEVRYVEGRAGLKGLYRDILRYPDQELLAWGAESFATFDEEYYRQHFVPERLKNKIWVRLIAPDSEAMRVHKKAEQSQLRQSRLLLPETFHSQTEISLYGKKKVSIISYEEQLGVVIESPQVYAALKDMFEAVWNNAPMKKDEKN